MDTIENFIGNSTVKEAIVNWLNYHFHSTTTIKCKKCGFPIIAKGNTKYVICPKCNNKVNIDIKKYIFLYGRSGNGKSYLSKILANSFGVDLLRVTPLDIQNTTDLNEVIKSINMKTLSGRKHKIILIDDIDEYNKRYKMELFRVGLLSIHPVIYTSKEDLYLQYQMKSGKEKKYNIPIDFIKNTIILRLYKPTTSEMFRYLKTISNLSDDILKKIAKNSKSFRSSVLSTYTANVNDLVTPYQSKRELLKSVKERRFKQSLRLDNWNNTNEISLRDIFKCIKGYDDNALVLSEKLAEFDYRMRVLFEEIDPCFINDMTEPIETIDIDWAWKSIINRKNLEKKDTIVSKKISSVVKKSKSSTIYKYL